jgi:hypothetical protein
MWRCGGREFINYNMYESRRTSGFPVSFDG